MALLQLAFSIINIPLSVLQMFSEKEESRSLFPWEQNHNIWYLAELGKEQSFQHRDVISC